MKVLVFASLLIQIRKNKPVRKKFQLEINPWKKSRQKTSSTSLISDRPPRIKKNLVSEIIIFNETRHRNNLGVHKIPKQGSMLPDTMLCNRNTISTTCRTPLTEQTASGATLDKQRTKRWREVVDRIFLSYFHLLHKYKYTQINVTVTITSTLIVIFYSVLITTYTYQLNCVKDLQTGKKTT